MKLAMKYLGVMLDEKLNFNEHIDYTTWKAARKFGVLCRINRYLTAETKVRSIDASVEHARMFTVDAGEATNRVQYPLFVYRMTKRMVWRHNA